ncbi:uncharacterized protein LOC110703689 [Chenopodium quinoa]|uniref:uncharacterized protein LOC110703689 n=1 Tax=Chenopodium quinoa TaxID=63459 RepID=UPI000B79A76E|nr:uncharacterized protein LOC110703689 [Chenopodium quinoa]
MDDFVYWKYSKDVVFSTKSAYAMLLRNPDYSAGLLNNALPLTGILQQHGIPVDTTCVLCLGNHESVEHLFRDCPLVREVWVTAPLIASLQVRRDITFSAWFVEIVLDLRRNKSWETLEWVSRSLAAEDFKSAIRSLGMASTALRHHVSSSCLLQGSSDSNVDICLVFDGAYTLHDHTAGAGWIFRSSDSDIVLGGGCRAFTSSSTFQSELQTCLWALKAADRRGFRRLLIYTDCSTLLTFLTNKRCQDISCLWLLQDIKVILTRFLFCEVRKVPRQWVAPAHWLASQARQRRMLLWSC